MSRVLLACGGTGGHIAPGIALAQRLTDDGHACVLVVSRKSVDARMTADYQQFTFVAGRGRGFGPGWINRLLFLPALVASIGSSLRLLRGFRPDVLVCFGGFMSVGPALACWLRRIPVIVHESNRRPGKAVRLIARFARALHLPAGVRLEGIPLKRQHDSGFPVRKEIRPSAREVARKTLGFPTTGKLLLVAGGSQGSRALTKWVESQLAEISGRGLHVLCLTGPGGRGGEVRTGSSVVRFLPFCNQMGLGRRLSHNAGGRRYFGGTGGVPDASNFGAIPICGRRPSNGQCAVFCRYWCRAAGAGGRSLGRHGLDLRPSLQ